MANQNVPNRGQGQQKLHEIRNAGTGESRQVSQEEWKAEGKTLRDAGWARVDKEGAETPEGGQTPDPDGPIPSIEDTQYQ